MAEKKNIFIYGNTGDYLVVGKLVTPQDPDYAHLKECLGPVAEGQSVVRLSEEQIVRFLSSSAGRDLVDKVLENHP